MGVTAALMAVQAGSSYQQASAYESEGNYQKSIANINARFSKLNAQDAINRGGKEAEQLKKQAKQLIGTQRVNLAAQGIDVESGSALDVQTDTAELAEIDAMTIRNNAWKEAWGYRVQAMNETFSGKYAQLSAQNKSRNTLLAGGLQAAQMFSGRK